MGPMQIFCLLFFFFYAWSLEIIVYPNCTFKKFPFQVAASMKKDVDAQIPNYPNLPSKLLCVLHNVTLHVRLNLLLAFIPTNNVISYHSLI